MADSTAPLLPTYAPTKKPTAPSVDDAIETCIGATGLPQLLQSLLVALAWAFDAQQTFINVFTDAQPSWHCTAAEDSLCSAAASPCGLPSGSWAWDRPARSSMVSEWDLQCSNPAVVGLPASAFFAGCLVGGMAFATLADSWLGRKKMLVLSCLAMSLAAALAAASPNVWAYAALRFVCGVGRATVGTSALVLSTELVGKRWRDRVSIAGFFFFTLGFLSLPATAYLGRDSSWRSLYLWTSVPCLIYTILIHLLVSESPRWLLVRGRKDEAIGMLKSIALSNGNVICSSFSTLLIPEEASNANIFSAMKILWEKRWACRRLAAVMTVGFGVGMVYYGMPLAAGNLGSNLYMSAALNASAEVPASLVIFFLIGWLNRRAALLAFTILSGASSIMCAFIEADQQWRMAVEVASFFSACTAFSLLLIYCLELFPTCVRNSALAMARQALVLGGVFAPLLVAAGRKESGLSFGVFGLVIGCCGLFAVCLPETRGGGISDTMEEEEHKRSIPS